MTPKQAEELPKHDNVGVVFEPCAKDCLYFSAATEGKPEAPDDLEVLGQFPENDLSWCRSSYLFDGKAGEDLTVCILDGVAQPKHLVRKIKINRFPL